MIQPVFYLGIGHDQRAVLDDVLALTMHCLQATALKPADLAAVATIETKVSAGHVADLGRRLGLPVRYFTAAQLEAETPRLANPSDKVFRALGCHGVAEAAALAAAGTSAELALPKTKTEFVTCAIARRVIFGDKGP